jgi:hypothetical protein
VFPVIGTALAATALFLLSTMGVDTSRSTVTAYMAILGIGIGLSIQTLILAVQNSADRSELGVATSTVTFFRSMGGSIGVALFGAIFNNLLSSHIGTSVATGEGSGFSPAMLESMTATQRTDFIAVFADSITTVFLYATPLVLLAFALTWFLREIPLRSSSHADDRGRELAAGSAVGTAEPEVESMGALLH